VPLSPDGGVIADYAGELDDPAALAAQLSATPGVVEHGLFPPALVADVLVARGTEVDRTRPRGAR
jgi:ribose 5-phosphate isomerase A